MKNIFFFACERFLMLHLHWTSAVGASFAQCKLYYRLALSRVATADVSLDTLYIDPKGKGKIKIHQSADEKD